MTIHDFVAKLQGVRPQGDHAWVARCPAHEDNTPSLSVTQTDNGIRVKCFAGCSTADICRAVGSEVKDLFPDSKNGHAHSAPPDNSQKRIVKTYDYVDELGNFLYQKVRYEPKDFRNRRHHPTKKGEWIWDIKGVRRVLYNLPNLIKAVNEDRPVFIVDGEKDVDTLAKNGFVGTCQTNGCKEEWDETFNVFFENADLTIIKDKDKPGREYGEKLFKILSPLARITRLTEMPDRNGHKVKDVSDWFKHGGSAPEFDEFIQALPAGDPTKQIWTVKDLITYDTANDKNAVIGIHDGKTTRYLCKGAGAWIIGQSGIGKSSLSIQQAFCWALGFPFFGINPVRALRVLIVQNENDQGDCAEATQGIVRSICKSDEHLALLADHVRIIRCRGSTGAAFCDWLCSEVTKFHADLVYVDPLLRFAGIDVGRQDQCTKFLNDSLDPMLASTGVVLIGAHHTGKPKSANETKGWTIYDLAYSGIGSSELVNWARAISILRVLSEQDNTFELLLAKRGNRAWASHPDGGFTTTIYLQHATDGLYWKQINPEDLPNMKPKCSRERDKGGRPSKIQGIASLNIHDFLGLCTPEGESNADICVRLETYLGQIHRIDIRRTTARRVVEALVANGKLSKTASRTYIKGPNA